MTELESAALTKELIARIKRLRRAEEDLRQAANALEVREVVQRRDDGVLIVLQIVGVYKTADGIHVEVR